MSSHKFFRCKHCGNLVGLINNAGVPMTCCGEPMEELIPNTVDAAIEKHLPCVTVEGNTVTVKVGTVAHPMLQEHHIEFIYLNTENGGQRKALKVGAEPTATFTLVDDKAVEVFAYCNIHGLWKITL
ncbi:MAG: desulfoferrodoxin family protein [Oscillospiraceae bacterium]